MNKLLIAIALSLICVGATACGIWENNPSAASGKELTYIDIKPEEAKQRLEAESGILLLDVRTEEEYAQKHIPDSILIPVDVIEKEAPEKLTDKDAVIFVYCRSGNRSRTAASALVKMGYTNVYNLGGMNDWPYETVSDSKSEK